MARLSQKELDAAVATTKVDPSQETKNLKYKPDIVYYTIWGKHSEVDEDGNPVIDKESKAYAKQVRRGSKYDYYVKVGNSGHLFDPLGLYATREESKLAMTRGKSEVRLIKTNKQVFDYYIAYLRTKNKSWLSHASREM